MEEPFSPIDDETVGAFLDRLAARSADPAGGASAALQAAQAAALVAMVARFAEDLALVDRMDDVRRRAARLIAADGAAYAGVLTAAPGQRGRALVDACAPQAEVWDLAAAVIEAAQSLAPGTTSRLAPDLVAGAVAASAALRVTAMNIHANLRGVESAEAGQLRRAVAGTPEVLRAADRLVAGHAR